MPNIKQYDAPALDIRPTEVGVEATAAVGRRAGAFFNQVGSNLGGAVRDVGEVYTQYLDHQEISFKAKQASDLRIALEKKWDDERSSPLFDPNNPSIAAAFREEALEPALEKFKEGATTQKSQQFVEHFTEQFRNHMALKTMADASTMAGIAVHRNAGQMANNLASAVNLDPSSLEDVLKQFDTSLHAITDTSPNLAPEDRAKVHANFGDKAKRGIVQSAVMGLIEKNPNVDLDAIQKKYGEYIDGPEMQRFQKAAQAYAKRDMLQTKQIEQFQKQQAADGAHRDLSKTWTDSVSFDADGKPTIRPDFYKRVMDVEKDYPGASTERVRSMINWGQAQQRERREVIVTNPEVHKNLYDGLFRSENTTTDVDIMNAAANPDHSKRINDQDARALLNLQKSMEEKPFRGPRFQAVMAAAKEITGADLTVDGHERYASFMNAFIPQYIAQERAGTLKPNALNTKDPESLISQTIKEFTLTPAQRMNARIYKNIGMSNPAMNPDINGDPLNPQSTATKRMIGNTPVPAPIAGIAALQYNATKRQFRDTSTGKTYDISGREVK